MERSGKKEMSEKERRKKRVVTVAVLASAALLLGIYYMLHLFYVLNASPGADMSTAAVQAFAQMFLHPGQMALGSITGDSFFMIVSIVLIIAAVFAYTYATSVMKRHEDPATALGDASFMSDKELAEYQRDLVEPIGSPSIDSHKNFIASQEIRLSMDSKKTDMNLNTLIIGGSGTGKSFRIVGPNLMQMNSSYIVTDPSGELYASYAPLLEYYGYRIKVMNLDHMERSDHYDPFRYINDDNDIAKLVTTIITNTTDPRKTGGDEFWTKSEQELLTALIAYLWHYESRDPSSQNISKVMDLVRMANIDEDGRRPTRKDALDELFERVSEDDHFTKTQYQNFKMGAGKTLKSILISAAVRLQGFDMKSVMDLTSTDDIDLDSICDRKTALFIIIPTGESTFNYIASMMYSQLFQNIYRYCENEAQYSQLVCDSDGEVVKVLRASSMQESMEKKKEAEEILAGYADCTIKESPVMKVSKKDGEHPYWEIRTASGEMVAYRGSRALAEEALGKMRNGYVKANMENSGGRSSPIHVRFVLDEFANTGKIPEFEKKLATVRKYNISCTVILQSITQIQGMYDKTWGEIPQDCDMTVYLGGGLDSETTKWISENLGKRTVRVMGETFSSNASGGGGSQQLNLQSVELLSQSRMRTMDRKKCVVLPRGHNAHFGYMYNTLEHPKWKEKCSFAPYMYDAEKARYLTESFGEKIFGQPIEEPPGEKPVAADPAEKDKLRLAEGKSKLRRKAPEKEHRRSATIAPDELQGALNKIEPGFGDKALTAAKTMAGTSVGSDKLVTIDMGTMDFA